MLQGAAIHFADHPFGPAACCATPDAPHITTHTTTSPTENHLLFAIFILSNKLRCLCYRVALKIICQLCILCVAPALFAQSSPSPKFARNIAAQVAKVRAETAQNNAQVPFHASWNSLAAYRTPDWFRDAKIGIFLHWGVYSVPAFGNEWYSRNMYIPGNPAYEHQIALHGSLEKFGYKDFIPLFRAQHFDPDAWIDLFVKAGARYVVPVAEHCDGFAMYASAMTPYNAVEMSPHRDVVGELARATRARGLHFGVSSHTAEHWW